jgi:glycosyltransferase involved in cell wall biosynthesis
MEGINVHRFRYAPDRFERLAYEGGIPSNLSRTPWLVTLLPLFFLAQLWTGYRQALTLRPEVVHAHWLIPAGLIGALLKRFFPGPLRLVITAHGADIYGFRQRWQLGLKRWLLKQADVVTAVSEALAAELHRLDVPPDNLHVQGMGTDLTEIFVPVQRVDSTPTLLYAGRLVGKKGVDTLLRAAVQVHRTIPEIRVLIAGHGPEHKALENLGRELGIDSIIDFTGPYQLIDLPSIYAKASLAVFPFRATAEGDQDGLGLAIIEAMGCGVPVIASDIKPLDDLLIPEQTGWRAPADDPEAFAAAILEALSNPAVSNERASRARKHVLARHDWAVAAELYAEYLQPKISPCDGPPPR